MPCFELNEAKRLAAAMSDTSFDVGKDAFIMAGANGLEAWEAQNSVIWRGL